MRGEEKEEEEEGKEKEEEEEGEAEAAARSAQMRPPGPDALATVCKVCGSAPRLLVPPPAGSGAGRGAPNPPLAAGGDPREPTAPPGGRSSGYAWIPATPASPSPRA